MDVYSLKALVPGASLFFLWILLKRTVRRLSASPFTKGYLITLKEVAGEFLQHALRRDSDHRQMNPSGLFVLKKRPFVGQVYLIFAKHEAASRSVNGTCLYDVRAILEHEHNRCSTYGMRILPFDSVSSPERFDRQ